MQKIELKNGFTIYLERNNNKTINTSLRVNVGGVHDTVPGIAHFIEHILCLGRIEGYTAEQVQHTRGKFGYLNANTSKERTQYIVHMLATQIDAYIQYMYESMLKPAFDQIDIDEERQRILREISDKQSQPEYVYGIKYMNELYQKNSPYTYQVIGTHQSVQKTTQKDLKAFHKKYYHASNMELFLVGGLPKDIEKKLSIFEKIPSGKKAKSTWKKSLRPTKHKVLREDAKDLLNMKDKEKSSAVIYIGVEAPKIYTKQYYSLMVLVHLLGGDINSLLFKNVSRKQGLAYSIGTRYIQILEEGMVEIFAKVPATQIEKSMKAIEKEIQVLQQTCLPQEELERVKQKIMYHISKSAESNEGILNNMMLESRFNISLDDILKEIHKVTMKDVQKIAKQYLPHKSNPTITWIRNPLQTKKE